MYMHVCVCVCVCVCVFTARIFFNYDNDDYYY